MFPRVKTIDIGSVIVTVEEGVADTPAAEAVTDSTAEDAPPSQPEASGTPTDSIPSAEPAPTVSPVVPVVPVEPVATVPPVQPIAELPVPTDQSGVAAGPAIRRLAREVGIDLRQVAASGEHGRVTREDGDAGGPRRGQPIECRWQQ